MSCVEGLIELHVSKGTVRAGNMKAAVDRAHFRKQGVHSGSQQGAVYTTVAHSAIRDVGFQQTTDKSTFRMLPQPAHLQAPTITTLADEPVPPPRSCWGGCTAWHNLEPVAVGQLAVQEVLVGANQPAKQ